MITVANLRAQVKMSLNTHAPLLLQQCCQEGGPPGLTTVASCPAVLLQLLVLPDTFLLSVVARHTIVVLEVLRISFEVR